MTKIFERVDLENPAISKKTKTHHLERYVFASNLLPYAACLDLGCGTGYGTEILRKMGEADGVDSSIETVRHAVKNYPRCKFYCNDIHNFVNSVGSYTWNLVVMFEVIEHLSYERGVSVIRSIPGILKPGGKFVMSTPRDINDKYNTFHRSEWSYGTIKNVCGSVFDKVTIYGQDWDTAKISQDDVRNNDFYVAVCE